MPDYIGNITVPEIVPSGVFPLVPDYPLEVRRDHEVAVHQFGSGNAKIEQRILLGAGARRFTIRKQWLSEADRIALRNFWESKYGPYGAFTYYAPNDSCTGTTPVICRFANELLSWEMVADWACSLGVTLIEIPQTSQSYPLNQTVHRFPPAALQTALLSQVQEIFPLIRIQPLQPGYPAILISDRRCSVGGQLYQARLIEFDGISQSIGNESDEAQFTFGNADRVMRNLANDVDLFRAEIAFSLFHVGTGIKLDLWKGNIVNWTCDSGPEFRVTGWRLNRDYSIDIQGRTTTDSMYDLVAGPKPADVVPEPPAEEVLIDTGVPGVLNGVPRLGGYGTFAIDDMTVAPDASGNANIVGAHEITLALYYVDELTTDLWASIDTAIDAATDPVTVVCTVNPDTQRVFRVGDFVVFNDESADPANPGRRSYECAQIIGPGAPGDVVPSGVFHLQRAYPGVPEGQATFGTLRCAHLAGIRFYKLDQKTFSFSVRKGFFRTPDLPARIEAKLPSACIVAALAYVANHFGYGPFTVFPLSRHNEPYMPGLRTCNGGAYTFQVPGPLTVQENVVIPMKVQDAASIRCVYAYLQRGTTDGQSAFLVKISRDGGATWEPLEHMGIAQALPDAYKATYDFLVNNEGYGLPATRRLPYADYGLVLTSAVTAGPDPQTLQTASYGANRLGLAVGGFVFLDPGGANEEYVRIIGVDPDNQTFDAIVTKGHDVGERIRPTIWPTPVLNEGDDLAFDILAVASPDPGSDLTVVIQT